MLAGCFTKPGTCVKDVAKAAHVMVTTYEAARTAETGWACEFPAMSLGSSACAKARTEAGSTGQCPLYRPSRSENGKTLIEPRYIILFGACLTQFTVIGLLFSYGLFFSVFETEFGWSRTLLSSCSSLSFLMMGILAMAGGRLSDRFGPARVLAVTGVSYGIGFALISLVSEPWQLFLIFGTFIGLGLGTHDVVTLSTIGHWFERRRGIMSGVVKVGTAVGQIVVPPLTAVLILAFGWRPAIVALGVSASIPR